MSDDRPPMFAVVHANVTLQFDNGQTVQSIPLTFVIRSRPDIGLSPPAGETVRELAAKIVSLPGWKSPAVEALVDAAE